MRITLLVLALLVARSVGASEPKAPNDATGSAKWHVALAGGVGVAYGVIGIHVEFRRGHWAGFLGAGVAAALGARWFSGKGDGFVLSLHADLLPYLPGQDFSEVMITVALTAGWRFRLGRHFFIEAGVGPAVSYYRFQVVDDDLGGRRVHRTAVGFGALGPYPDHGPLLPDVSLALGWKF